MGYNHAQIGGILAVQWKLPARLAEAISYHHCPNISQSEAPISYIINIANFIAKKTFLDSEEKYLLEPPEPGVMEYLGVADDEIEHYCALLQEEYLKAETFMKMAGIN